MRRPWEGEEKEPLSSFLQGDGTGAEKQDADGARKRKYVREALSLPIIGEMRRRRVPIRPA